MAFKLKITDNGPEIQKETDEQKPFTRINIYMILGCLALIVVGFCLMLGPGSSVETGFNPDIFSTRRIVIGPMLAFFGFALMAVAILYKPGKRKDIKDTKEKKD